MATVHPMTTSTTVNLTLTDQEFEVIASVMLAASHIAPAELDDLFELPRDGYDTLARGLWSNTLRNPRLQHLDSLKVFDVQSMLEESIVKTHHDQTRP